MVNLAGRTLPYGPLKFKASSVAEHCMVIYRQVFLTFMACKSLKLSYTLNCVLKRANDLKKISGASEI